MRTFQHLMRVSAMLALTAPLCTRAQSITAYRYWFDDNASAATAVTVSGGAEFTLNTTIDASALNQGYHKASLQFEDNNGHWGSPVTSLFVKTDGNVAAYRYWYDDDMGTLAVASITPTPNAVVSVNLPGIPASLGYHRVSLQFQNSTGTWNTPVTSTFVKAGADLVAREYWFDDDASTLQSVNVTATPVLNVNTLIDATALGAGGHTITLRSKDAIGNWTVPLTQAFDVTVGITEIPGLESVVLMPNPADDQLQLRFNARADLDLSYDVIDATGRSVRDAERASVSGSTFRTVDVSMFAPGFYQLRLIGTNGAKCIPFVKR